MRWAVSHGLVSTSGCSFLLFSLNLRESLSVWLRTARSSSTGEKIGPCQTPWAYLEQQVRLNSVWSVLLEILFRLYTGTGCWVCYFSSFLIDLIFLLYLLKCVLISLFLQYIMWLYLNLFVAFCIHVSYHPTDRGRVSLLFGGGGQLGRFHPKTWRIKL